MSNQNPENQDDQEGRESRDQTSRSKRSYKKYKFYQFISYAALAVIVVAAAGLVFGAIIMLLWNSTIAEVFAVSTISFWQAIGLYFLAKLFFGFGSGAKKFRHEGRKFRWAKFKDKSVKHRQFQEFWDLEGRAAYERFREHKQDYVQPGPS